jgi:predicted Rdx family selenoprotein
LNAETEHEAFAEEGAKSQYDVVVDGQVIFSKQESGRFPEPGEVRKLLG